jgi:hypothetical protein
MSDDDLKPSDQLYYAIAALRGWDEASDHARRYGGNYALQFGRLVSSILVAAGEDRVPLAVTGVLDQQGNGNLAVIYDQFVVSADVVELSENSGEITVTVHGFDAIDDVQVSTTHNFFDGTTNRRRHEGIELQIRLAGRRLVFPPMKSARNPLLQGDAVFEAYAALRDKRVGR